MICQEILIAFLEGNIILGAETGTAVHTGEFPSQKLLDIQMTFFYLK